MKRAALAIVLLLLAQLSCTSSESADPVSVPEEAKPDPEEVRPKETEKVEIPSPSLPELGPSDVPLDIVFSWPELSPNLQQSFSDRELWNDCVFLKCNLG